MPTHRRIAASRNQAAGSRNAGAGATGNGIKMNVASTVRQNVIQRVADFHAVRARRAVASEENFWLGKCAVLLAAHKLTPERAQIIFRLAKSQGHTKQFQNLCLSLH